MASSVIKQITPSFVYETIEKQITWQSTSNPSWADTFSVAKTGYKAIFVGYYFTGSWASGIFVNNIQLHAGDSVSIGCRMAVGAPPDSTTQKKLF